MIQINDIYYSESFYEILTKFKLYLLSKGIRYLNEIKNGQHNIMVTCPFHKDGNESKASCGISTTNGIVHCFTCGTVRTFTQLLSYCLGYNDNGEIGEKWLRENILKIDAVNRKEIRLDDRNKVNNDVIVSEQELDSYRFYHPYMFERKLTKDVIEKFDVGFDKSKNCITFPVKNENGKVIFIARRSVVSKFFNYPQGVEKPLYGAYEMDKNSKEVIICESIFNCLTCYVYGKQAIALNGTGSKEQIEKLKKLNVRTIYLGLDNDEAGNKGAERIYKALRRKFIIKRMIFPIGKDINDLEENEFKIIYNNAKII